MCHPLSFSDVTQGSWPTFPPASITEEEDSRNKPSGDHEELSSPPDGSPVDMLICSFALHLVETPSELFALLWELSTKARWLILVSPHKKPEVRRIIYGDWDIVFAAERHVHLDKRYMGLGSLGYAGLGSGDECRICRDIEG